MKDDKTLLPQKSQFGDKFWLIRDDLAVCENGRIFNYDELGKLIETQYECILDNVSKASSKKILANIIDLKNIIIDDYFINLIEHTIDGNKFEFSHDMNLIKYKGYVANLNTLEIAGLPQEMEKVGDELILPDFPKRLDENLIREFQAPIKLVFRKDCNKIKL
ncbi:hypothetical protein DIO34_09175 [Campylobacter jejuni]|nr:hypothetical protein [Campylobacter jejuni]